MKEQKKERKKDLISITELAKLRNVTTETLRHYDRIGLLKPTWRDEDTGVRYYSLLSKDEKLGTIKELRQLGMSLGEIKEFLNQRNLKKSCHLLQEKQTELHARIEELEELEQAVSKKVKYLQQLLKDDFDLKRLTVKTFGERYILRDTETYADMEDLEKSVFRVETRASGVNETLGVERFALLISRELAERKNGIMEGAACIFLSEPTGYDGIYVKTMPAGSYLCKYIRGSNLCSREVMDSMLQWCGEHHLQVTEDILQVYSVDVNLTDDEEEIICEMQIPVKSAK